jgi:hypothetical protein
VNDKLVKNMGKQNLILLIGTNPTPNYVVTQILKDKISRVYLVYSENTNEQIGTKAFADTLESIIQKKPSITCQKIALSEINSAIEIKNNLDSHLNSLSGDVHLNYTGGTKMMAVHVYLYLKETYGERFSASYLDARTFSLVYDDVINTSVDDFRNTVSIDLKDMLNLHGYELCGSKTDLGENLANYVNTIISGLSTNPSQNIPNDIQDEYPIDSTINKNEIQGGKWLEKVIFLKAKEWVDNQNRPSLSIYRNVSAQKSGGRDCEIDITVLYGYQLILISISKTKDQGKLKAKAFEVYHRAKQLGGEEARVILVTGWKKAEKEKGRTTPNIEILKSDLSQSIGTTSGNLIVIGQEDWLNIGNVLATLIKN